MEERQHILSAVNISIGYHSRKHDIFVAENVSVQLKPASLTALIGANGIGKSTLLRTLSGIQKPLKGEVLLNGKNVGKFNPKELAQQLSLVLTESLPPSNLTVFELAAMGRQPYTNWLGVLSEDDRQKTVDALKMVELSHLSAKKHYEISDGQLQKALIARALAQDTPLIVMDEPTTHLDLLHKVSLLKLLKELTQKTGKSILYSTHDLDLALQLSDEIIVMTEQGVVQGTPHQLIQQDIFNRLFPNKNIRFDAVKGGFVID